MSSPAEPHDPIESDEAPAAPAAPAMRRRQLVAGALVAATVVAAGRGTAAAATGDPVLLGGDNVAGDQTIIENTARFPISGNRALFVACEDMSGGVGIEATGSRSGVSAIGRSANAQFPSGQAVGLDATTLDADGYGAFISAGAGRAPLLLVPMAIDGAPTTGNHRVGEVLFDRSGRLFICTASGLPGTWTELGAPAPAPSAGTSFIPLPTVERFVDTRTGVGIAQGTVKAGSTLSLVLTGRPGQTGDPALQIPDDAVAVTGNLTVTGSARVPAGSSVTVWPGGRQPPTPLVFFPPANLGSPVTNSFAVGLASIGTHRGVNVFNSAACDFSLDVTGYHAAR